MTPDQQRERHTGWQVAGRARYLWLLPVLAVIALGVVAARWLTETPRDRDLANVGETGSLRPEAQQGVDDPGAVSGTSGNFGSPETARDEVTRPGANTPETGITPPPGSPDSTASAQPADLGSVLGDRDPREMVGQQVQLRVPAQQAGSRVTFWVGQPGDRLLVVLNRDTRGGLAQDRSLPSDHGIVPVEAGAVATITGLIERLPYPEARYSWVLTRAEREELESTGVYLRAERVQ